MVRVPYVERLATAQTEEDDPYKIDQWNRQHNERLDDGPPDGMGGRVEMRKDCQNREEIPNQVAAAIAQKRAGTREIPGQKPQQGPASEECQDGNQVLPVVTRHASG